MKYNDGKYHIEWMEHAYYGMYYLGKHKESSWTIVNVYGEPCRCDGIIICFSDKSDAVRYCKKLNIVPEGAVLTNLE